MEPLLKQWLAGNAWGGRILEHSADVKGSRCDEWLHLKRVTGNKMEAHFWEHCPAAFDQGAGERSGEHRGHPELYRTFRYSCRRADDAAQLVNLLKDGHGLAIKDRTLASWANAAYATVQQRHAELGF
ncbi:Piso0_000122 protein (plasmid) [Bradyrhizobium diazoefficiens]|uniref:Piso0_000122 protein n=1 Tax=Bradyrhizobium diazoefficiens TaxID=1355477 RepID=A0A0E3VXV7_9BRAD|nr:Piso0_000122 protein [Bradyrhizobium diazoefficiens]